MTVGGEPHSHTSDEDGALMPVVLAGGHLSSRPASLVMDEEKDSSFKVTQWVVNMTSEYKTLFLTNSRFRFLFICNDPLFVLLLHFGALREAL